ncbi:MAG: TetR family transcriptional regulator [Clostridia bacterium]|nr:TetR family transcriptional regulator [Clostridia bacterium]
MAGKSNKKILAESFRKLAENKDVSKITVRDIVTNCHLSAPTFYHYFRDKYELLAWIYEQENAGIILRFNPPSKLVETAVSEWVRNCNENRTLLLNLMNPSGKNDSYIGVMIQIQAQMIEEDIVCCSGNDALTKKIQMMVFHFAASLIPLMRFWLEGKVAAATDEPINMIREMIPKPILPLITAK